MASPPPFSIEKEKEKWSNFFRLITQPSICLDVKDISVDCTALQDLCSLRDVIEVEIVDGNFVDRGEFEHLST